MIGEELSAINIDDATLTADEKNDLDDTVEVSYPIRHFGTDFDVAGLVRRLENEDIVIPSYSDNSDELITSGFQRGFIWTNAQMDRFVESLLLGFPIPGLFLVKQPDQRLLVLDGQQRLMTLYSFYRGLRNGKEFKLENVSSRFVGLTYQTLSAELRRQIDNSFLQATIVSVESEDEVEPVYQIFERLNSGGTQLTPHEIRVALYTGKLIEIVAKLNDDQHWRDMFGPKNKRLRDHELILKILALYLSQKTYSRPLKSFLNDFCRSNREGKDSAIDQAASLFLKACRVLDIQLGRKALRRESAQVNTAIADCIVVGIMHAIARNALKEDLVPEQFEQLMSNDEFVQVTKGATADEKPVQRRLELAKAVFAGESIS